MNDQLKNVLEQQLRDVHTPEAISWWPLSIGWWFLIATAVIITLLVSLKLLKRRRQNAYRGVAIAELDQHFALWQEQQKNDLYLQAANAIVKRACSHLNSEALSLSGQQWLEYLSAYSKELFSSDTEFALSRGLYQADPSLNIELVHQEIKAWLINHQVTHVKGVNHA